ncbi:VanZ family protein [Patescibacteria group bacterium]|nr:VanZ family protein [Patescibacteria group bacterium]
MKFNKFSWLVFLIYWLIFIFALSHQEFVVVETAHKFNISEMLKYEWTQIVAHFIEYLVLCLLLVINFNKWTKYNLKSIFLMSICLCMIYAISDEYHQTFIAGRSSSFYDLMFDFLGTIAGLCLYKLYEKKTT